MDKINIVLGITGSVAAFKGAELASLLTKDGKAVHTIMTDAATKFVTPLTFQSLTKQKVYTNMFEEIIYEDIRHISLAQRANVFVIAPATANIIGKIAGGIADDMLSTVVMATEAPVIICPAMNTAMYENSIVQANIEKLQSFGYIFVDPKESRLACGDVGKGAMQDPAIIFDKIKEVLNEQAPKAEKPKPVVRPVQHQYSLAEVEEHLHDPEVVRLFEEVERITGDLLTDSDRQMFLNFYDSREYKLPVDVILFLLKEYADKGNSYLRKVAQDWSAQGITTVEGAVEYTSLFNNEYRQILRASGVANRDPVAKEMTFMNRWLKEDEFPMPLIQLACEKAVLSTGKPNLPYADGILSKWRKDEITTVEQAEAKEKEYYSKDNVKKFTRPISEAKQVKATANKSQNYQGRTWDYDALAKLEQAHIDKKVAE
ncbi:MAG: DnaD domain protein [Defluviitaleaceae bacterium]|nr:DnaD domain protein [Defluviitaleaceae bacterium]